MPAYKTQSLEFQQVEIIAQDLLQGLPELPSSALGFLTCDSQVDYDALLPLLAKALPFPLVGGTTMTNPLSQGDQELAATLLVIHKEDMLCSIALSAPFAGAPEAQVGEALERCLNNLDDPPKLLMTFFPMLPGMEGDACAHRLFSLANGIPVFGGMMTDDLGCTVSAVFENGLAYPDRMLLIGLGGDIRPVVAVGNQMTVMAEHGAVVTDSTQNVVHRVDDMTFCDYMQSLGIQPEQRVDKLEALIQYGPLPFRIHHKLTEEDGVPELRCLSYTDPSNGNAAFSSALPIGVRLQMGLIEKNDVIESCQRCASSLLEQMEAQERTGYSYSAVLFLTCSARYFAILNGALPGVGILRQTIPPQLPVSGCYSFLEIGHTLGKNGSVQNRSHNASIVMCAL